MDQEQQTPPTTDNGEWTEAKIAAERAAIFREVEQGTRADRARQESTRHSYRPARTKGE